VLKLKYGRNLDLLVMEDRHMEQDVSPRLTDEDWLNLGKADAWAGRPKTAPEEDPQNASLYDLGYSEGSVERSRSGCTTASRGCSQSV
jgi:hypothetical protein